MNQKVPEWYATRRTHKIFLFSIFLLTGIAFYFALPQEARFRYEYQKGRPWMHATLYAPYDFAIQKSESVLQHEKDSLLQQQVPYFVYADSVTRIQLAQLEKSLERINPGRQKQTIDIILLRHKLSGLYADIYNAGIIEQNFINNPDLLKKGVIKILKNNTGKEIRLSEVYTLKSAYKVVQDKLEEFKSQNPDWASGLEDFQPEKFLSSNLLYDNLKNRQAEARLLDNLSVNHGIVQEGERIISQGDIISPATFSILESLRSTYEKSRGENARYILVIAGRVLLIVMLLLTLYLFLLNIRRKLMRSKRDITFILVTLCLMIVFCSLVIRSGTIDIYIVPFTALALIIRTFLDTRVAIFVNTMATLIVGFMVPNGYEFVLLQIPVGSIAVISLNKMQRREQLLLTALLIFISYSAIFIGFSLIQEANLQAIEWVKIKSFALNSVLTLVTYLLIYILEKSFGFVSDVTLVELSFSNQKLLKRLSLEAPGTFHHCLQVANLSEMAISKIGGNALLVRAGAMYHDIGKIANSSYFIENQTFGNNPHDNLTSEESASIILEHVQKGVDLARKHKIPEQVIDFIRTHHGTTKTGYFYHKSRMDNGDQEVEDKKFSYTGPLPFTRETAVVMLADSIEAASRSLAVKNPGNIRNLVDNIIRQKIEMGQLEYAPLTFKDIRILKELFQEKLINMYHVRMNYPDTGPATGQGEEVK